MQDAVFRPKREIYALKKLARTAALTVLANFFFGLIFQNPILQQAPFDAIGWASYGWASNSTVCTVRVFSVTEKRML